MRINWKAAGLVFLAITTLIVGLAQQKEPSNDNRIKRIPEALEQRLAQLPTVDFSEEDETNPIRKARNNRHNSSVSKEGIKKPRLHESMAPVLLDLPLSDQPVAPALPVASEVVVVGTVQNVQAFLSTDRTSVYSEITVNVEEVLKGNQRLLPGVNVTVERNAGAVRFASGKTLRRGSFR